MPSTNLGSLVGAVSGPLADAASAGKGGRATVGELVGESARLTIGPPSAPLELLGGALRLDGEVEAALTISGTAVPSPFDQDVRLEPPEGSAWVELRTHAQGSCRARSRTPAGAMTLSLAVRPRAEAQARILRALPLETGVVDAARQLAAGAAWLSAPTPPPPAPGEAMALAADFSLDLGLEAELGVSLGFESSLFADVSEPMQARFDAVLRGSLGLELEDEMRLVVGRVDTYDPERVRILLERVHCNRLTLGVAFSLQVKYDLASPFLAVLDETFECRPFRRVMDAMRELGEVAEISAAAAAGDWDTVRRRLSAESVEALGDFLGDDDLWQWLGSSPEAGRFFAAVRRLLKIYDYVCDDERLRSLWEHLLGRVDLAPGAPLRRALEAIAELDPADLEASLERLLDPRWRRALDLLEVLTGVELEQLLLADESAREAFEGGVRLARRALRFLEEIPGQLGDRLRGLAERSGLAKVVRQLRALSNPEALRGASHATAARVVERLLGRGIETLDEDDLRRIRSWAGRLSRLLEGADLRRLDARLREQLAALEGKAGFSVAVEVDRLSRRSALVDVEVAVKLYQRVAPLLAAGAIRDALERIHAAGDSRPESLPFAIRDCVFTSRRVRTSAVDLLLSLVGWTQTRVRRVHESWQRMSRLEDGRIERRARFSGAVVEFFKDRDRTSTQAGTWLSFRCRSRQESSDLDLPHDEATPELRLTMTRRDAATRAGELRAIERLLYHLGFIDHLDGRRRVLTGDVAPGSAARLGITLRLAGEAVQALLTALDDQAGWDTDVLNAAHRWFDEPLLKDRIPFTRMRAGRGLAMVLASPLYRRDWRLGRQVFEQRHRSGFEITCGRGEQLRTVRLSPLERYPGLVTLQTARAAVPGRLARVAALLAVTGGRTPQALMAATGAFAATMRNLVPGGWHNPQFLVWLVLARLTRLAPERLGEVRGTASLRWQTEGEEHGPLTLRLATGLPAHPLGAGIFPFVPEQNSVT